MEKQNVAFETAKKYFASFNTFAAWDEAK